MRTLQFDHLYTECRWLSPGYICIDSDGWIIGVSDTTPSKGAEYLSGIALPGIPNLHSHAFQRGMAGLSEYRTDKARDSFWTWRKWMYQFVGMLSPEDLEAIAAQLYVEMLKSGYTAVGEFQYLHHDCNGASFEIPAEMSLRTLAASREAGIGVTLLPVLYRYSGFGDQPPEDGQRRFVNNLDTFMNIYRSLEEVTRTDPDRHTGIAPHSLRAADAQSIYEVVGGADSNAPIHIHIAEQEKEVVDCIDFSGKRPLEYLYDTVEVDARWSLIHATHMKPDEVYTAASSGVTAGLCPTTEANLGDGLFDLPRWLADNGALGVGSDSNISVSPVEELRWLEYGQRLRERQRNVSASDRVSTGKRLFDAVIAGGAQSLGRAGLNGEAGLKPGARADIIVLDLAAPIFAGHSPETFIDTWIFSGNEALVTDVFVGGSHVVQAGRHHREKEIASRYRDVLKRLLR